MAGQDEKAVNLVEVIKQAMMVELKGEQLYQHAAKEASQPEVRALFLALAADEVEHLRVLEVQLKSLQGEGRFDLSVLGEREVTAGASPVIDEAFKASLRRGVFELAVVSIGCDLERRAIEYYQAQAAATEGEAQRFFSWLASWEEGHLQQLMAMESLMQEAYWAERGFSPF